MFVSTDIWVTLCTDYMGIFKDTTFESIVVTRNSDIAFSRGTDGNIYIDTRQINRVIGPRTGNASGAIWKIRKIIATRLHNNSLIAFLYRLTQF